jgi:hypothetical protein
MASIASLANREFGSRRSTASNCSCELFPPHDVHFAQVLPRFRMFGPRDEHLPEVFGRLFPLFTGGFGAGQIEARVGVSRIDSQSPPELLLRFG